MLHWATGLDIPACPIVREHSRQYPAFRRQRWGLVLRTTPAWLSGRRKQVGSESWSLIGASIGPPSEPGPRVSLVILLLHESNFWGAGRVQKNTAVYNVSEPVIYWMLGTGYGAGKPGPDDAYQVSGAVVITAGGVLPDDARLEVVLEDVSVADIAAPGARFEGPVAGPSPTGSNWPTGQRIVTLAAATVCAPAVPG